MAGRSINSPGLNGFGTPFYVTNFKSRRRKRRRVVKEVVEKTGIGLPEIKAALTYLKAVGSVSVAKQAFAAAVDIKKIV